MARRQLKNTADNVKITKKGLFQQRPQGISILYADKDLQFWWSAGVMLSPTVTEALPMQICGHRPWWRNLILTLEWQKISPSPRAVRLPMSAPTWTTSVASVAPVCPDPLAGLSPSLSLQLLLLTQTNAHRSWFLCTAAGTAVAHLSHRNSVCLSVQSHEWIRQKQCKLGSPNLHRRLPGRLWFQELQSFSINLKGSPQRRALNKRGCEKFATFSQ